VVGSHIDVRDQQADDGCLLGREQLIPQRREGGTVSTTSRSGTPASPSALAATQVRATISGVASRWRT